MTVTKTSTNTKKKRNLSKKSTKSCPTCKRTKTSETLEKIKLKSRRSILRGPKSGWIYFCNMNRQKILKENIGISFGGMCKILGQQWQKMSPSDKQPYRNMSLNDKKRYENDFKTLTREERMVIRAWRKKRKEEKKLSPKVPLSAYMFFVCTKRNEVVRDNSNLSFQEIGRLLGTMWNQMTEKQKEPYREMNAKDRVRYQNELTVYNQKMNGTTGTTSDDSNVVTGDDALETTVTTTTTGGDDVALGTSTTLGDNNNNHNNNVVVAPV